MFNTDLFYQDPIRTDGPKHRFPFVVLRVSSVALRGIINPPQIHFLRMKTFFSKLLAYE